MWGYVNTMLSSSSSNSEVSNSNQLTREQIVFFDNQVITCRDVEKLYMSFRDKELPRDLYQKIESHIERCEECQMMVDTYELVVSVAGTLNAPEVKPRDGFQDRLRMALNERLGLDMR